MTKSEEHRCYLLGVNLAIDCIAGGNDDRTFDKLSSFIPEGKKKHLREELIFFRASLVGQVLFSDNMKSKEHSVMVADYFFSKLSDELGINSVAIVSKRALEYAKINHSIEGNNAEYIYDILAKSNIKPDDISKDWVYSFSQFLSDDLKEFWFGTSGVRYRIDTFNRNTHENSGCFGSVLAFVFVICFLVYMI